MLRVVCWKGAALHDSQVDNGGLMPDNRREVSIRCFVPDGSEWPDATLNLHTKERLLAQPFLVLLGRMGTCRSCPMAVYSFEHVQRCAGIRPARIVRYRCLIASGPGARWLGCPSPRLCFRLLARGGQKERRQKDQSGAGSKLTELDDPPHVDKPT